MGEGLARGPVALVMNTAPVEGLVRRREASLAMRLRRSGEVGNARALASRSVVGLVRGELLAIPISVVLSLVASPLCLLLLVAPLAPLFAPEVRLRDRAAQRKEGVERELPFFSAFVGVLGGAGVPLYAVLRSVREKGVFPYMEKEALLLRRDVEVFGADPSAAIERVAEWHPSRRFAEFLLGYTSKARSGGDVSAYLSSESARLLRELGDAWGRYVARIGVVGSLMVTVFGVVPLLLMVVGVFSPGFSTTGLVLYAGVGVPSLTAALLLMAARMQPAQEEEIRGSPLKGALAGAPAAVLGYAAGGIWTSAAAGIAVFLLFYGAEAGDALSERRRVDEGVSRFLRDLLDYKRQEYDLSRAVMAIEAHGRFTPAFGKVLAKVAAQLRAGVPLDEVSADFRSRMGRVAFLLLGEMSRSGGGTVDTVYQVSSFSDRLLELRDGAAAEMRPYLLLSYVSPVLLAVGVAFVGGVLSSFAGAGAGGVASLGRLAPQAVPPALTAVSDLLIVLSAAALGLIGAKIADFTVRNTVRASLNVAVAVAAVGVMALLGSHSPVPPFLP